MFCRWILEGAIIRWRREFFVSIPAKFGIADLFFTSRHSQQLRQGCVFVLLRIVNGGVGLGGIIYNGQKGGVCRLLGWIYTKRQSHICW